MKTFLRTSNNHLQSGLLTDPNLLGLGNLAAPVFYTKPGVCSEQPRSPFAEARHAARRLREEQSEEISLCISGGVDSDAMLQAFLAEGVAVRSYVFRYRRRSRFATPWNQHDLQDAFRSFREKSLKFEVVDIDAQEYFESGAVFTDSAEYLCPSPQLCLQLRILDLIPGCPVLSWNAPNSESGLAPTDRGGLGLPGYKYFSFDRYFEKRRRAGVAFFFLYTPELLYSFLNLPRFQSAAQGSYALKCDLYRDGGFTIRNRQNKFTGFERLREYYDRTSGISDQFNRLYRYPLIEKLSRRSDFPKTEVSLVHKDFLGS